MILWSEPSQANGVISIYNIYINDTLALYVHSNMTTATLTTLIPYTIYVFTVEACTTAGCTRSAYGLPVTTLQDGECADVQTCHRLYSSVCIV